MCCAMRVLCVAVLVVALPQGGVGAKFGPPGRDVVLWSCRRIEFGCSPDA